MPRSTSQQQQSTAMQSKKDTRPKLTGTRPSAKIRNGVPYQPVASKSRLESHRLFAAVSLVLLMLLSALGPLTPSAPDTAPFITPRIDGSARTDERAVFSYIPFLERQSGNPYSVWPDVSDVLTFSPSDDRVRRAIVGSIYASLSSLNQTLAQSGLESRPQQDKLSGVATSYAGQAADADATTQARGLNGLAAIDLIHALNGSIAERVNFEATAVEDFQAAIDTDATAWQYTYNWSLANFLAGNYSSSYEGMKQVITRAEQNSNLLAQFWASLAVLRAGDPGEATVRLTHLLAKPQVTTGDQDAINRDKQLRTLSKEALGDAQRANRDPASAYQTYFDTLRTTTGDTTNGPYAKWVRLGLQQRGYEGLLADFSSLMRATTTLGNDPRLHHDRARLLSFLGRNGEALQEYSRAAELGSNDPPLLVSYGEALASSSDYNGALTRAQDAIKLLGNDPGTVNLTSVARTAADNMSIPRDVELAQELLDANLLRARVFGLQNNTAALDSLLQGITQGASLLSPAEGGLLLMYGGFAAEAGGRQGPARDNFNAAWDKLKGLAPGVPGRTASLVGLARTTASAQGVDAALTMLRTNGYDATSPLATVTKDPAAPDVLAIASTLLQQAGRGPEAANLLRVSAVVRNLQDAHTLTGVGRPLWIDNGTIVQAEPVLQAANTERTFGNAQLAEMRYRQAYGLAPALAPAWNNLGVLYAQQGNAGRADFYLKSANFVSHNYAWGAHNYATYSYTQGYGNFFSGERAAGNAVKVAGPASLLWSNDLRYDERGTLPAPSGQGNDLLARIPALLILVLLLLHTIVGRDRIAEHVVAPTRGVLGKLAAGLDARFKTPARKGLRALLASLVIPSLVGMLALAWGAGRGSFEIALVFLPVALLAALLAFAANEVAQYLAARAAGLQTVHHNWPLGVLLGIICIPFGFVYGWQINTRMAAGSEETDVDANDGHTQQGRRAARSLGEGDLIYEAQAEAAADEAMPNTITIAPATIAAAGTVTTGGIFGLTSGARIMFAGLMANLAIGLIFGLVYWFTGWPSMRLALFAQTLVLAFTAVSEPPADGWTLYRRNTPLWLATFLFASIVVTLLAIGIL